MKHKLYQDCQEKYQQPQIRDDTTLMAESERRTKEPLDESERESEKVGLILNLQKIKITESGPTPSWQIDGKTTKTVTDFILGVSKITADGDYSHEIKRSCSLEEKL